MIEYLAVRVAQYGAQLRATPGDRSKIVERRVLAHLPACRVSRRRRVNEYFDPDGRRLTGLGTDPLERAGQTLGHGLLELPRFIDAIAILQGLLQGRTDRYRRDADRGGAGGSSGGRPGRESADESRQKQGTQIPGTHGNRC